MSARPRAVVLLSGGADRPRGLRPFDLRAFGGSALTADLDVPKDRPPAQMGGDIPITYVPARNTIFLSLRRKGFEDARVPDPTLYRG